MVLGFEYDDGGHRYARGATGDCATRAIAVTTGEHYLNVLQLIRDEAEHERGGRRSDGQRYTRLSAVKNIMRSKGWTFVDMRRNPRPFDEWKAPKGTFLVWCPMHFTAVKDGVIHDMFDPRREGIMTVKGYWYKNE